MQQWDTYFKFYDQDEIILHSKVIYEKNDHFSYKFWQKWIKEFNKKSKTQLCFKDHFPFYSHLCVKTTTRERKECGCIYNKVLQISIRYTECSFEKFPCLFCDRLIFAKNTERRQFCFREERTNTINATVLFHRFRRGNYPFKNLK